MITLNEDQKIVIRTAIKQKKLDISFINLNPDDIKRYTNPSIRMMIDIYRDIETLEKILKVSNNEC
jgi:hypothetical protein